MDASTAAAYERGATAFQARRDTRFRDRAVALADSTNGPVLDAGCGPGGYLPHLGGWALGLDSSPAMLRLADHPRRLLADVRMLPLRSGSLGAVWSRNGLVHLRHDELPNALRELHRATEVGARLSISLLSGPDDSVVSDDDLPGRVFSRWSDDHLVDVVTGAGFDDVHLDGEGPRWVEARRARTLADTVAAGLRVLVCGLNPSLAAADAGVGFVSPSNRFWPAAVAAGLVSRPRDPTHALRAHGVGMTDLVKRATRRADELSSEEYRAGLARVERLCARLEPGVVLSVGLAGWRSAVDRRTTAGWQDRELGGRPVYVMPSTSGLNARTSMDQLVGHLRAAVAGP